MKNKRRTEGRPLGRFFSVYYAVCIVLAAVFILVCGASFARIGTQRVASGASPELITWDAVLEWLGLERPSPARTAAGTSQQ